MSKILSLKNSDFENDSGIELSIFIPCYNEEENIIPSLETALDACHALKLSFEILVIDDASTDRSVEKVENYIKAHPAEPIKLRVNEQNQGLAYNFANGAFLTRGTWYRLVCGDNAESSEALQTIFSHLGAAEVLIPYHIKNHGRTLFRKTLSRIYTILVNLISGNHLKYYNGMLVTRRWYVMRWHSDRYGFGFFADLVTRLLSLELSYQEIGVMARERVHGKSKAMSFRNFCSVGYTLCNIFFRRVAMIFFRKQ